MSSPIAGPIVPTTTAAPDVEHAVASTDTPPPVENPPADGDWRARLTDADRTLIVTLCAEQHARRRPLHREARDLQHRIEGTTHQ